MSKNLVIVESPAKAKTIENYLGKEFIVKSSIGHIRDLPKKGGLGIDIENGFLPKYEVSEDKKKVVEDLRKDVNKAETVWIATDEDREGEAIAWHLEEVLNLKEKEVKRIVFHEITKKAITKAVKNPRQINKNLVDAQQARRVLDRLVGFKLSPVLWRKVKQGLSAGRVQSVAVRLIVEREKEIEEFNTVPFFKTIALFKNTNDIEFKAELSKKFNSASASEHFLRSCIGEMFIVNEVQKKPAKKSPPPPFTTSTLQQEASRKLGYSVSQTMSIAQKLYEAGHITYMRTDSFNLSKDALTDAENQIQKLYGTEYSQKRVFSTKSKGAQEAHEAIRPTEMINKSIDLESNQKRLYNLIWKRTIASQMSDVKLERTSVKISTPDPNLNFVAKGEVVNFEGFMKVYTEGRDEEIEEDNNILPEINKKDSLNLKEVSSIERFSKHPARYTEATLVKKLEDLGIGRPSTYASIITTIQKRDYVVKESREGFSRNFQTLRLVNQEISIVQNSENTGTEKNKMFPTDIGVVVNGFLVQNFQKVLDYGFTAMVEKDFDEIAIGKKRWNNMIEGFYGDFSKTVEDVTGNSDKVSGEKMLGVDPVSGKNVYVRIGPFGPMAQIGERQLEENQPKPKFASLLKNQSIQTISLESALELFKLPRIVGQYDGEDVVAAIGRFGPYLRHKGKFTSINKKNGDNPFSIKIDRAIELIKIKIKADEERIISSFDGEPLIQVLNGRYGPFIQVTPKKGKKINVKIPKETDAKILDLKECMSLIEKHTNKFKKK